MATVFVPLVYKGLVSQFGTIESQKEKLIDTVIESFADPAKWPMTDGERIEVLKKLYFKAVTIRKTERARAADETNWPHVE